MQRAVGVKPTYYGGTALLILFSTVSYCTRVARAPHHGPCGRRVSRDHKALDRRLARQLATGDCARTSRLASAICVMRSRQQATANRLPAAPYGLQLYGARRVPSFE